MKARGTRFSNSISSRLELNQSNRAASGRFSVAPATDTSKALSRSRLSIVRSLAPNGAPKTSSPSLRWKTSALRPRGQWYADSSNTLLSSTANRYTQRTPSNNRSTSKRVGRSAQAGSSRKGRRTTGVSRDPCRKELATNLRISSIARRMAVFPEALAPNIPTAGSTRTGLAIPAGTIDRGTPFADSLVASSERWTSSRYDRAFSAVNDNSMLGADCPGEDTIALLLWKGLHRWQLVQLEGASTGISHTESQVRIGGDLICDPRAR